MATLNVLAAWFVGGLIVGLVLGFIIRKMGE